MKMTEAQYDQMGDLNKGYCVHCDAITTNNVYPDERDATCIKCMNTTCMGVEEAKIYGHIEIEDEGSDEVGIISFGDDEEDEE